MGDEVEAAAGVRREVLLAGISDLQSVIAANDAKSSAALVVHGLLLTATLTITQKLGGIYVKLGPLGRTSVVVAGALALAVFLASVMALIRALTPFSPTRLAARLTSRENPARVFFPPVEKHQEPGGEIAALRARLPQLDTAAGQETELLYELTKLAHVRRYQAKWTIWGLRALGLEVLLVTAYLVLLGWTALRHAPAHAHPLAVLSVAAERNGAITVAARTGQAGELRVAARLTAGSSAPYPPVAVTFARAATRVVIVPTDRPVRALLARARAANSRARARVVLTLARRHARTVTLARTLTVR